MKFCTIDDQGRPTGFYDEGVHGKNIPEAAFEISDEDWSECLANAQCRVFNDDHELIECRPPEVREAEEVSAWARVQARLESDPVLRALIQVVSEEAGIARSDLEERTANRLGGE